MRWAIDHDKKSDRRRDRAVHTTNMRALELGFAMIGTGE
jgi:hypothetical protein